MLLVVLAVLLAIKDSGFDLRDHSPSVEAKMAKFRAAGRTGRTEWARGAAGFGSAEAAVLEIDQSHPEPKHGDAQGHGMHAPTVTAHAQTWDNAGRPEPRRVELKVSHAQEWGRHGVGRHVITALYAKDEQGRLLYYRIFKDDVDDEGPLNLGPAPRGLFMPDGGVKAVTAFALCSEYGLWRSEPVLLASALLGSSGGQPEL